MEHPHPSGLLGKEAVMSSQTFDSAASSSPIPSPEAIFRTPGPKQVALTIDDGPASEWTPQILSVLKTYDVHATFFMVGSNIRANPGLVSQVLAGGHLIGNHSDTHPDMTQLSAEAQGREMDATTQAIVDAGAPTPYFFRPPMGYYTDTTVNVAVQRGMSLVKWSNDTGDWAAPEYPDPEYQDQIIWNATYPLDETNPIILMHDGMPGTYRQNTVDSLSRIIEHYQAQGYEFTDPSGVNVLGDNPIGHSDSAYSSNPGEITVAGWAFDPNNPTAEIGIHVYINGGGYARSTGAFRPDVKAVHPGTTENQGYDLTLPAAAGSNHVIVYAINVGPGAHTVLLDTYIDVASPNPLGNMDLAANSAPGELRVAGWAFDPNNPTAQLGIHVYINGAGHVYSTGVSRPDVKVVYPQTSANAGFDIRIPAPAGNDHVTVYAINQGAGAHTVLWDSDINIASASPIGHLDNVSIAQIPGRNVIVRGWAFDLGSPTEAIEVHVYINGGGYNTGPVSASRPDVQNVYPQTTAHQGFDVTLPASPGTNQVCAYGINAGIGENTLLGCQSIDVP